MPPIVIIQARLSSQRLPGKVLRFVRGKPLIDYLVERLERCSEISGLALATSDRPDDDPLAAHAARCGLPCYRGSLDDVVTRFINAAEQFGADAFVRVCGDSPLLDPALVDRAVRLFCSGEYDLATNVRVRTFPKGQSVEVVRVAALKQVQAASDDPAQREHCTAYFYDHPQPFRIADFQAKTARGDIQLSVDTPEDLQRFEAIVAGFEQPHWRYGVEAVIERVDLLGRIGAL